jgi:Tol biopolymer transport system component
MAKRSLFFQSERDPQCIYDEHGWNGRDHAGAGQRYQSFAGMVSDGEELAFISDSDTHSGIYMVKIGSGEIYQVLDGYFHYAGLSWKN